MDLKKLFVKKRPLDYILFGGIIIVGIILDQLTKWLSVKYLNPIWPDSVPIIKDALQLTYAENTGAAFGSFAGKPWIFNSVSVVAIILISVYLFGCKGGRRLQDIALAMIVSGGIGNMIDRIRLGYVVDFIDFCLIDFAIFNGADSFVCVGAGLLILSLVLDLVDEYKKDRKMRGNTAAHSESEDGEQ